ncbi:hypothetical protein SOVF_187450, partial [Spinacia oleracea]
VCKMKHEHTFLDELNSTSRAYKVKVKVIEKGRLTKSPKKGVLYQHLLLKDDKGNKMRDAPIRPSDQQWKRSEDELDFQMSFGRQTFVQLVNPEAGPILPDYRYLAYVPRVGDPDDRYDVLGVVLYVEEEAREIKTGQHRVALVREIVITDHGSEQPMVIFAWSDLAAADCEYLSPWAEKFKVVGFTSLRGTSHKGFSLSTSMSTVIIRDPIGARANALTDWALNHQDILANRQARVLDVRNPSPIRVIITLDDLNQKTNINTMQEERLWVKVVVPELDFDRVHAYIGCCNCGRRTDVPVGKAYTCTNCSHKGSMSCPRVTTNCDISDSTGTRSVTMFTSGTIPKKNQRSSNK